MKPTITVDPRIYGGVAASTADMPNLDVANGAGGPVKPYVAPEPVPIGNLGEGTILAEEGQRAAAEAGRQQASISDAVSATVKSWNTTRVFQAINMPHFADQPNYDPKYDIYHAPFQLSEEEHKFLAQSKSQEEFNYKLDNLQTQRGLYAQMGDHPVLSTVLGMLDPAYIAADVLTGGVAGYASAALGASRMAGRIAAGVGAAADSAAITGMASKVAPISDNEIIVGALVNGAAGATFFHQPTGRFQPVDPTYPSSELLATANKMAEAGTGIEQRVVAEQANITPTRVVQNDMSDRFLAQNGFRNLTEHTDAYSAISAHIDDPEFGPMIRMLREEQPDALASVGVRIGDVDRAAYLHDMHTVYLNHKDVNDPFTVLHETIHGLTSQKITYGLDNPGTAHGQLVQELEAMRAQAEAHWQALPDEQKPNLFVQDKNDKPYFTKDLHEFVAGLFANKADEFTQMLAKIPATGSRNLLSKFVDTVRKLVGLHPSNENLLTKALGVTKDLMDTKLDVKSPNGGLVAHMTPNFAQAPKGAEAVGKWWDRQEGSTTGQKAGRAIEWSLHRELRSKGERGQHVADTLVDDPINMTGDSAVSQKQAIRSDLAAHQYAYEDALKAELARQGFGVRQRIFQSGKSLQAQQRIERQVYDELMRRENAVRRGIPVADPTIDPAITKLADLHDRATAQALQEMKAAGVKGADAIEGGAGYASRKWDITKLEAMEGKLMATGKTLKQARNMIRGMLADGIQRVNGTMPKDMAKDIAQAIMERTRRKGYFEDIANTGTMGDDGAQGLRSLLAGSGIDPTRMKLIEEFLTGRKDDAGVMSSLKHRVGIDMLTTMTDETGRVHSITDLADTNLTRNLDSYLDDAAGQAGLARKGLTSQSDIVALRQDYLKSVPDEVARAKAAKLFDDTIKSIKGQPVGEEMSQMMRRLQAVTTSVGLANSGLWQLMEYSNIAAKYGLMATAKEVLRNLPVARALVGEMAGNAHEAGSVANVLARNSVQDMRIRPFVSKLEDNHAIPTSDQLTLGLQQSKQLVPYINAMRFVHHNQANITANLVTDLLRRGAEGDAGARRVLAQYGLEGHTLDSLRSEIQTHGMTVDNWSDGAWASVRGGLGKMMDEAVLKNRTGEIPSFAQFSTLGKFIFTFRSFVLGAHNKVLAGTLGRGGVAGLSLLMLYQFPLSMMSSYAVSVMRGKPENDMKKLAQTAVEQMSATGLFSELMGIVSGNKQQFGSSGLMFLDRLYKTGSQASKGNWAGAAGSMAQAIPIISILPGLKALAANLK